VLEDEQDEEPRPEIASVEPAGRPGSPGARVTVTIVAGPKVAVGLGLETVTTIVACSVVVLVQVESRLI
jgi:hypothetical protein